MPARIKLLPDTLISQIAAGEVVERPASVVKELVENALDAGARRIDVELEQGGRRRVAVSDDGSGMGAEDVLLAFDRHATSKLASLEELERIATLGFRGEALAAIAAVCRLELVSAEAPGLGSRVRIEGGRVSEHGPAARARGTSVDVDSLFYNVPARRKFLKQPATELRRALEVVQGYALAHPAVHFELRHDGRELLSVAALGEGAAARRGRIEQLFGVRLAEHLEPLCGEPSVSGFVGDRQTTRGRRVFVFLGGRLLRDRAVLAAFYRSVRETWHGEDIPALFLYLDLPPGEVDVNVHPQKAEVRFRDSTLVPRIEGVLRRALAAGRSDEPVGLRAVEPYSRPSGLAWRFGAPLSGDSGVLARALPGGSPAREIREGGEAWAPLPEVAYRPWQAEGAALSGPRGRSPALKLLGQYKGSLILLEAPDGLYLVDQHAAHERVLYEELRRALEADRPQVQPLLAPRLLELGPAEAVALADLAGELQALGFELASFSGSTVALRGAPAVLSPDQAERLLREIASTPAASGAALEPQDLRRRLLDALAAGQACRQAVRIHHPLSAEKLQTLVLRLFEAEQPYACPHGRPTILKLDDRELERRFGRQGWSRGTWGEV